MVFIQPNHSLHSDGLRPHVKLNVIVSIFSLHTQNFYDIVYAKLEVI